MGKEAALLVPTGTMGNLSAVLAHCPERGTEASDTPKIMQMGNVLANTPRATLADMATLMASTGGAGIHNVHKSLYCRSLLYRSLLCRPLLQVLLGDNCHIYNYEGGGISALGGLAFHVLHNEPNGEILLEDLQAAIRYCRMPLPQSLCTHAWIAGAMPHAAACCSSMSDNSNPPHCLSHLTLPVFPLSNIRQHCMCSLQPPYDTVCMPAIADFARTSAGLMMHIALVLVWSAWKAATTGVVAQSCPWST